MTFTSLPGAVRTDGADAILHFGGLFAEQRSLASGGIVPRGDLAVLALSGSDRLSWLDSISSQSVTGLTPGASAETLILDPHGHIEHVLDLVDDGSTTWIVLPQSSRDTALSWLNRMRFRADVQIRDASAEVEVIGQLGDIAVDFEPMGFVSWVDPWPGVTTGGFAYAPSLARWSARYWLVPHARVGELITLLHDRHVPIAGILAWEALRIAAGRPAATDIDDRTLPHEFDWLRTAVHLNKGCYRGQETVAKVFNLGRPPRRSVILHLDGSDSIHVAPNDAVWAVKDGEPREVGHVVAAGQHWEFGPIALALVKRAMPETEPVTVEHDGHHIAASQEVLVPSDAGPSVDIPRLPRIGSRP